MSQNPKPLPLGSLFFRDIYRGTLRLIPFALTVAALRWISSAVAGIATTAEPVLAAGLAWWLLGQALGPSQLVGGALVVAGVLLAQLARHGPVRTDPVEFTP